MLLAVRRMIQLQNHRTGYIFEDRKCNVFFGHNRLSILELYVSLMVDQSRNQAPYNGEFSYNTKN